MQITDHPFTNTDNEYFRIKNLLLDIESHPEVDNNWDPGRMDWWRYNYHAEKEVDFFRANARYWCTETGEVVGLFISEYGENDFFIVVHPDHWSLFPTILKWGLDVWARGMEKISTDVYTFGKQKIDALKAAGFYEDGHVENVRIYPLDGYDFSYSLKPGFKIMTFAEHGDYASRVELVRNAFDNPNYSETRYRSLQEAPGYRPELDLIVVNPQGQGVGYCMGWLEEINPESGYIEPMGVHTDFRQMGLGKALAKECFKRLADLGAEQAWVASRAEPNVSNFLYDSLKPAQVKRSYRYVLETTLRTTDKSHR